MLDCEWLSNLALRMLFVMTVMAEKQDMRRAVKKLLLGQIDRNSRLGIEILEEIAERVFKESLPPTRIDILSDKPFAA
jgi:hypothetical protein